MRHHKHPGLAGRLVDGELQPHPDASSTQAQLVWVPVAAADAREVDALEGLLCVPTRAGAMRVASVPHVVEHLALGDEIAVADWEGEPMARGELALALAGTVRCVGSPEHEWRRLARLVDDAAGERCWFDVIGDHAVAASVPRGALRAVFATLAHEAEAGTLRWEYATPARHA